MTAKKSKRVVIINNIKSDLIDQAIFILSSDTIEAKSDFTSTNFVDDAQNIINSYISTTKKFSQTRYNLKNILSKFKTFFYILGGISAVSAVLFLTTRIINLIIA
ncbi:MAG: hypothetical protein RSB38_00580 [Oscillospiraceae bacterium]